MTHIAFLVQVLDTRFTELLPRYFHPSFADFFFPSFFAFISGFIVSFLCFPSLNFSDILFSLFNCFLLLFIP